VITPFARWLRRSRENRAMTQKDLGTVAAKQMPKESEEKDPTISVSFISNIENGRRNPKETIAQALAVGVGKPRDMGMFMAGNVPDSWLTTEASDEAAEMKYLEELFGDLNRIAMGAKVVVRGGNVDGKAPDLSTVEPAVHMSGEPDGEEEPTSS